MKETLFKSAFTLIFKDRNIEDLYKRSLAPKIMLFNKIGSIVSFCASFISLMLLLTKIDLETRFNPLIMLISNIIVAFLFFVSSILSFSIKNMTFHILIKYCIYIMMTFTFIFLRYYTRILANIDMIGYTSVMNIELVMRIFCALFGILCFWEILIMSIVVSIILFVFTFPLAIGLLYLSVYIAYYSLLIIVLIISYYFLEEKKSSFYFKNKLEINNDWCNDVFENMNNGFLSIQNKKFIFMNKNLIDLIGRKNKSRKEIENIALDIENNETNIERIPETEKENKIFYRRVPANYSSGFENPRNNNSQAIPSTIEEILDKNTMYDYCNANSQLVLNYLFNEESLGSTNDFNLRDQDFQFKTKNNRETNFQADYLSSEEILRILRENYLKIKTCEANIDKQAEYMNKNKKDNYGHNRNNKFVLLGNKRFEFKEEEEYVEKIFEISYRCYSSYDNNLIDLNENDHFEFVFNDVTRTKIMEEKNAELKYNSLFLSKIAHEFKNPLICIAELVDQTLDENDEDRSQFLHKEKDLNRIKRLKSIKSFSDYLLILIKDLDYFSQGQLDKSIEILPSDVDLNEILTFTRNIGWSLLMKNGKEENVKIKIEKSEDTPIKIITDEIRLKQILVNLVSNSVKFTNRGAINIDVTSNEEKLKFVVSDTGMGMSKNQMENLFKPFKKGKDLKKINRYGSGLGLSIVFEMTQKLGSSIECLSEEGQGTTFWFQLPIILPPSNANKIDESKSQVVSNHKASKFKEPRQIPFLNENLSLKMENNVSFPFAKNNIYHLENDFSEFDFLSNSDSKLERFENFIQNSLNSSSGKEKSVYVKKLESTDSIRTQIMKNIIFYKPTMTVGKQANDLEFSFSPTRKIPKRHNSSKSFGILPSSMNKIHINNRDNQCLEINHDRLNLAGGVKDSLKNIDDLNCEYHKARDTSTINFNNIVINNNHFKKQYYLKSLNLENDYKNIIIVDDEKLTRQSTLRILKRTCEQKEININVIEAEDGIECLYIYYKLVSDGIKISAILSDQTMNYMNGSKTAQIIGEIQEKKGISQIPFYILTAYEDKNSLNNLMGKYVKEVFTKPFMNSKAEKILDQMFAIKEVKENRKLDN